MFLPEDISKPNKYVLFMWFMVENSLKSNPYAFLKQFLAKGKLKADFSHPVWYDFLKEDGFSTNITISVEWH